MDTSDHWVVDTDIQLHRMIGDSAVSPAAVALVDSHRPAVLAAFSLVELKGNYFQDLLLLRNKVEDSDNVKDLVARIEVTGGRRCNRMLLQFADAVDGNLGGPWNELKSKLLVCLDTQLFVVWEKFAAGVDAIVDDLECARASEAPRHEGDGWQAAIPKCSPKNTRCRIVPFLKEHKNSLAEFMRRFAGQQSELTPELQRILSAASEVVEEDRFSWHGSACRKVGDLLVALHAVSRMGVLSSNKKEHAPLSEGIGYKFRHFPVEKIRLK